MLLPGTEHEFALAFQRFYLDLLEARSAIGVARQRTGEFMLYGISNIGSVIGMVTDPRLEAVSGATGGVLSPAS